MRNEGETVVFDNLTDWAEPAAFMEDTPPSAGWAEPEDGTWLVLRGRYGSSSGVLLCNVAATSAPPVEFDPGLAGWHDVSVRVHHAMRGQDHAVFAGTSKDRALRKLRCELNTEAYETLSLGPRDMTGATMRLDGSYANCYIDSVRFTPCDPPKPLPAAEKELCAICDFADAPDDYRPMEQCAAEEVRVHAEAGFTTIFWKAYAVRAEFHSKACELRAAKYTPTLRVSIGTLLEKYDTLAAAVEEAKACGVTLLGWMRINNETAIKPNSEWEKFNPTTPFHLAHPEMRKRYKNGELTPRLSFAFPEVREYLCAIGREILDRGTDGLIIDVLRHPPLVQYDKLLVDAFIEKTGEDPMAMEGDGTEEWLRFKATAFTDLLRDFRRMMDTSEHRDKPIYVRTMPQLWRNLRDGCDTAIRQLGS